MKNLLFVLCFLLPIGARADRQIVVRDGAKGEITLRITQDGDVRAFPAPSFEYYPNRITRPQQKSYDVPLYRTGKVEGEDGERNFGLFRATDLVVIDNRIFAVAREKAGTFASPSYLFELRVKFGHQLHWMESGTPIGALAMGFMIFVANQADLTPTKRWIGVGLSLAFAAYFAWEVYATHKNAAGDGWLSQKDGDLIRVDEVEREGEVVTDLLVSPANAPTHEGARSLRGIVASGCGPILSHNAYAAP